jgi:hypothetical protein
MLLSVPDRIHDRLARLRQVRITPRLLLQVAASLVMAAAVAGFLWVLWTESVYRRLGPATRAATLLRAATGA